MNSKKPILFLVLLHFCCWLAICAEPTVDAKFIETTKKRASQGESLFQTNLGLLYLTGNGITQNFKEAAKWFRKAAEQQDPMAQRHLGLMYSAGRGVPENHEKAVSWLKKSADLGDKRAKELIVTITLASAERGNAEAQYDLAVIYENGSGVTADVKEAVKWFVKAANQDHLAALNQIGVMFYRGDGLAQDYEEARKVFTSAAEKGSSTAALNVGKMHRYGQGGSRDYAQAIKWFRRGADAQEQFCMLSLADMYEKGQGIPQDYVEAHKWYNIVAATGWDMFAEDRDKLAKLMTPEQIAEAQKLAREWKPKKARGK
jgi:TPR repeat protein